MDATRPIDWWMLAIELLVLVVIATEAIISFVHWQARKTATKKALALLLEGQQIQDRVPGRNQDEAAEEWNKEVGAWVTKTLTFLKGCSQQAEVTFNQLHKSLPLSYKAALATEQLYGWLYRSLENLQAIMEKPEIYF
jgi:predicted metal-dependent hydrolase